MVSPSGTHWPVFTLPPTLSPREFTVPPFQPITPSEYCPPCLGPGSALAPTFWPWCVIFMQSSVMFSQVVVRESGFVTDAMLHSLKDS